MLKVEISGSVGEGKTTLAYLISKYLSEIGVEWELKDEYVPINKQYIETHKIAAGALAAIKFKTVSICTKELANKPRLTPALILESGEVITEQDVIDMRTSIDRLLKALVRDVIDI